MYHTPGNDADGFDWFDEFYDDIVAQEPIPTDPEMVIAEIQNLLSTRREVPYHIV
jgi:hypothetical protein